jgi:hypothetical protein
MRLIAATILAGTVFGSSYVSAHHGYAGFFDPAQRTTAVEGTLDELAFSNPHLIMKLRAADSTIYTITWQSPAWVTRQASVTKATFHSGDHLIVIGAPSRDPGSHEVTRIREIRRPADGWRWRADTPFAAPTAPPLR